MRKQQQIWQEEHTTAATLPSLAVVEPSSGVVDFVEYLKAQKIPLQGSVIDIGCGKGRNAVYLAKQGLEVYATDYISIALTTAKELAKKNNVSEHIYFFEEPIDSKWSFADGTFNFAIDCFSSIDIETKEGRDTYKAELLRTLKPGGYALVTVVSIKDEWESQLLRESPALEKNSVVWPQTHKFQKDYDEEELREFYKEFEMVDLREVQKPAHKLGRDYTAYNYWVVLRKPSAT